MFWVGVLIELYKDNFVYGNDDFFSVYYASNTFNCDRTLTKLLNNKSRSKFFGKSYDFQFTECKFESKIDVILDKVITDKKVYV